MINVSNLTKERNKLLEVYPTNNKDDFVEIHK